MAAATTMLKAGERLARGAWIVPAELVLVALLGAALAQLTWALLAPPAVGSAPSGAAAPSLEPSSAARQLFGPAAGEGAPRPAAAPRLRLLGVVASGTRHGGVAILAADGARARSIAAGEAIAPALILKEVHPGHVVVSRDGVAERIALERRPAAPHGPR